MGRVGQSTFVNYAPAPKRSNEKREYKVHAVNAFDSTRKRMSVVVQCKDEYHLLVKGADNVMLERSSKKDPDLERALTKFSQEGLRTLVIGRRKLAAEEFNKWLVAYEKA